MFTRNLLFLIICTLNIWTTYSKWTIVRTANGTTVTETKDDWISNELLCYQGENCVPYHKCKQSRALSDAEMDHRFGISETKKPIGCRGLEACCNEASYISKHPQNFCDDFFPTQTKCGFRNYDGLGETVEHFEYTFDYKFTQTSTYSEFAEFPWVITVVEKCSLSAWSSSCYTGGGSLIHPKIVLTTRNNVALRSKNVSKLFARAGEWHLDQNSEPCTHQEVKVESIIQHEQEATLALLVLEKEFKMTPFVSTICLPPKDQSFAHQDCFFLGYGKVHLPKGNTIENLLKKLTSRTEPISHCEERLKDHNSFKNFEWSDKFICADVAYDTGMKHDNAGFPLVCAITVNNYYQVGIAGSWDFRARGSLAFFTSVPYYRDWIDGKLADFGIGNSSYTF